MKLTKIILLLISALTFFACEDKNIFPHPMTQPVKATDLSVLFTDLLALPDGRVAALVRKSDGSCAFAVIDKNGNFIQSRNLDFDNLLQLNYFYESSSGDYNIKFVHNKTDFFYWKLNNQLQCVYSKNDTIITSENKSFDYKLYAMMDDGKVAEINTVVSADNNVKKSKCKLRYLYYNDYSNNNEHYNAFEYDIETEDDFFATNALSFGDKIILYNECDYEMAPQKDNSLIKLNTKYRFYILNTDGSIVKSGECDNPIHYIKYVDGFFYIITSDDFMNVYTENDTGFYNWKITKIDVLGNEICTSDIISTYHLFENITILYQTQTEK